MAKAGRKLTLTPELIKKIEGLLKLGNYANAVYDALNIGSSTWYKWIDRGKKDKEEGKNNIFVKFADVVKNSRAIAEINYLSKIRAASDTSWQAAAWYLERVFPDRYRRRDRSAVELSGPDGKPVEVTSRTPHIVIYLPEKEGLTEPEEPD